MTKPKAISWGPPHPRCCLCGRFVGHFPAGYGDGKVWCQRCADRVEERRLT
jgi:hypothetical protein